MKEREENQIATNLNKCLFCSEKAVINAEKLSNKMPDNRDCKKSFYSDKFCLAILAPEQLTRGHSLIISRRHYEDICAIPVYDDGERIKGIDAVKFCKRNENVIRATESFNRPYDSSHSFGTTYMAHRLALELPVEAYAELKKYAENKGLLFFSSVTDEQSVDEMESIGMTVYKVASRDLTNQPLLRKINATGKPWILSTGMSHVHEIEDAIMSNTVMLMVCTSTYPTPFDECKLDWIQRMKGYFKLPVGWSDHSKGNSLSSAAVALGALAVEKHITLDTTMKGTDHRGALEPPELWHLIRNVRAVETALIAKDIFQPSEQSACDKLRILEGRILK